MTTFSQNHKNEKGFSLLELLLVVAVGAVLILAGLAAYRLVSENNNVNEAARLINTLKQQVQRAYQSEGEYNGDIQAILTDLRAFPAGVLNAAGEAQHPFGDDIEFVANGNSFDITFENIGRSACLQIGQLFNENSDSDFVGLTVDGADADAGDTDDGTISIADLQAVCPASDAGGLDMTWTFF
jgi:prepilin-type N-terminal cleavage/methylation domain-containing protein